MVKNLPGMWEMQVHPLEKEMATHSSIRAWSIPWTEKPGRLQSMGHKELDTTEQLTLSHFYVIGCSVIDSTQQKLEQITSKIRL